MIGEHRGLGFAQCIRKHVPRARKHISISLHHGKNTPIYDHEYRTELAFWMKYLGLLVIDPKN
jgi:hypothetical protein